MTINTLRLSAAVLLHGSLSARAAIISENTTTSGEGIPYKWEIGLSGNDSATVIRHVGAWSWEDNSLFVAGTEDPVGWTHTSDWVKLSLSEAAIFTLTLSREENVAWPGGSDPLRTTGSSASFFPSFTIYTGTDTTGAQDHTFNNKTGFDAADSGAIGWADPLYRAHLDNSTLTSASLTLDLSAGDYSIALGSNAPANDTNRQGYRAVLSTVPEPGSSAFLALTGLAILRRRRR
jgi:uncharacterized protein (TIGR03382 family)